MRVLFLGDISIDENRIDVSGSDWLLQAADVVVGNLEGAIVSAAERAAQPRRKHIALSSSEIAPQVLQDLGISAVSLANNHVYDFSLPIAQTRARLEQHGIQSFGAGRNLAQAGEPAKFSVAGRRLALMAFGWEVIGCLPAGSETEGVNPFETEHVRESVRRFREEDPHAFLAILIHWNYDQERYPQPAHRTLAHELLASGADAILGHHSHVVESLEWVDGKLIAYGLGNWIFPRRQIEQAQIGGGAETQRQLAVELVIEDRQTQTVRLHWFRYDPEQASIAHQQSEELHPGAVDVLAPFQGYSQRAYIAWFRKHRVRRKALPIFINPDDRLINRLKSAFIHLRQMAIEGLLRLGLKRGSWRYGLRRSPERPSQR